MSSSASKQPSDAATLSSGCPLEPWFVNLLRDPRTKTPLSEIQTVNGVLDFRVPMNSEWREGQDFYETWERKQIANGTLEYYENERAPDEAVYNAMPIKGACLDVGGLDGRVRVFMEPGQPYACVDPYAFAISDITPHLAAAYPALKSPVNFVCGTAEYLPIADETFETVHMRSVIDHMQDPLLALKEAHRVLKRGGQILVIVSVIGGLQGKMSLREMARETARYVLVSAGVSKYQDHHLWHPTFPALCTMIERAGFLIDLIRWQNKRVVCIRALKTAAP